jgi:hypothetical protein
MRRGRDVAAEYLAMAAGGITTVEQAAIPTLLIRFRGLFREVQRRRQTLIHLSIEAGLFALGSSHAGDRRQGPSQSHSKQSTPCHSC